MSRYSSQSRPIQSRKPAKPERLISTANAAKRLGVSPNSVRRFIAEGKLTAYKVGRLVKLDPQDVEDFISKIETGL